MRLQQACINAFGSAANDLNFMRKIRNLLKLEGIEPSVAGARKLRYNCVEVWSDNPPKTVHVSQTGLALHIKRIHSPSQSLLRPVDPGYNAF